MTLDEILTHASRLASRYRLAPPARLGRGPAGAFQHAGGGQSIDFHDFRQYQPGDDLRRVDWRAYARTGAMHLKLFREEVSPVVELFLDTSASMGAYPGKAQAVLFIAAFLAGASRSVGGRPALCYGGERHIGAGVEAGLARAKFAGPGVGDFRGARSGAERPWRFLISDFLVPEGSAGMFPRLSAGALAFTPLLVLSRTERDPEWIGGRRLVDAEAPENWIDMMPDAGMFTRYRLRLRRHEESLAADAMRCGGRLLALAAPDASAVPEDLDAIAKSLADAGVVTA